MPVADCQLLKGRIDLFSADADADERRVIAVVAVLSTPVPFSLCSSFHANRMRGMWASFASSSAPDPHWCLSQTHGSAFGLFVCWRIRFLILPSLFLFSNRDGGGLLTEKIDVYVCVVSALSLSLPCIAAHCRNKTGPFPLICL